MYLHGLREFISEAKEIGSISMPSFCTANELVCETLIEYAKKHSLPLLIESTSNQVNQFGGYCNMRPLEFKKYIFNAATRIGLSHKHLLLGGDHLGPLPWRNLPAETAMGHAKLLVHEYVSAGYEKIHLDTSIHLGDDDPETNLDEHVIARRGAILYQTAIESYKILQAENPDAQRPVFIIGSEVPSAGGSQKNAGFEVTSPEALKRTLYAYRDEFEALGLGKEWRSDVVAIVVQPGVEFHNHTIQRYSRKEATLLSQHIKSIPGLALEAHSTDYQPLSLLQQMVEDGMGIVKVGPALTKAMLEAMQALAHIESELIEDDAGRAGFFEALDAEMIQDATHWKAYYQGAEKDVVLAKKYSFFDRRRYYLTRPKVQAAQNKLFKNIDSCSVPPGLLSQYMPLQFQRFWETNDSWRSAELVKDHISRIIEGYYRACGLLRTT